VPRPDPLAPGEAHVLSVTLGAAAGVVERLRRHLADDEVARAARFRFEPDRERFTIARGVLREVLAAHLDVPPAGLAFRTGAHGKPALAGPAAGDWLRFNVSHSGDIVLVALARARAVGVDVERVRADIADVELARRFFSAREQAALAGLPEDGRRALFFRIWTCKEAFVKATGDGVSRPLRDFDVVDDAGDVALRTDVAPPEARRFTLAALPAPAGYAAAVAVEVDPTAPVRVVPLAWEP
jgi:4'-phosphopantetheinyl transferase